MATRPISLRLPVAGDEYVVPLDGRCRDCSGHGTDSEGWTCVECDGRGVVPTAEGRAVLLLVSRYGAKVGAR